MKFLGSTNANAGSWGSSNQQTPQQWGGSAAQQPPQASQPQSQPTNQGIIPSQSQPPQAQQVNEQIQNTNKPQNASQVSQQAVQSQGSIAGLVAGQQSQPIQAQHNVGNIKNDNEKRDGPLLVRQENQYMPIASKPSANASAAIDNNPGGVNNPASSLIGGGTSTAAAKNQLEQLNTMREALFSQDGWGCQHVNQDTNWDVPGSPEPINNAGNIVKAEPSPQGGSAGNAGGPPVWKPNINNGTELWEANLRNGGQPPPAPVQKTPWGHTPSSNLGGTWGEDDDGVDSANVWTGAPSNPATRPEFGSNEQKNSCFTGRYYQNLVGCSTAPESPQQPPAGTSNATNTAAQPQQQLITYRNDRTDRTERTDDMSTELKRDNEWTANVNNTGGANNWVDPRGMARTSGNPNDIRNTDPRDARNPQRYNMPIIEPCDPRELLVRGDLRGISGKQFISFPYLVPILWERIKKNRGIACNAKFQFIFPMINESTDRRNFKMAAHGFIYIYSSRAC